jgi:hypothetical protein
MTRKKQENISISYRLEITFNPPNPLECPKRCSITPFVFNNILHFLNIKDILDDLNIFLRSSLLIKSEGELVN